MKRTFAKQRLMTFLASFFLFGVLLLTANRAVAQGSNWMQSDQAKTVLINEVSTIGATLSGLTGQALNDAKSHLYYYKEIYARIDSGMSTEEAALSGLSIFNTGASSFRTNDTTSDVTVTKAFKSQLYNDASNLLH